MKGKLIIRAGKMTPNGREAIIEVRRGAKGAGEQVGNAVVYWPWSPKSEEKAFDLAYEIARRYDIALSDAEEIV